MLRGGQSATWVGGIELVCPLLFLFKLLFLVGFYGLSSVVFRGRGMHHSAGE